MQKQRLSELPVEESQLNSTSSKASPIAQTTTPTKTTATSTGVPTTTSPTEMDTPPPVIKRRVKEPKISSESDIIKQLQDICMTIDPRDVYSNMVKIGQG
jgi:hypothetical protein